MLQGVIFSEQGAYGFGLQFYRFRDTMILWLKLEI